MTPRLLKKIVELVEAGATVVGTRPEKSPGLENFPACDEDVKKLADRLWGDGNGEGYQATRLGQGPRRLGRSARASPGRHEGAGRFRLRRRLGRQFALHPSHAGRRHGPLLRGQQARGRAGRHVQLPRRGQAARVLVAAERPRAACRGLAGPASGCPRRRDPPAALPGGGRIGVRRLPAGTRRARPCRRHDARRPPLPARASPAAAGRRREGRLRSARRRRADPRREGQGAGPRRRRQAVFPGERDGPG